MRLIAILAAALLVPACASNSKTTTQQGTGGSGAAGETQQISGKVNTIDPAAGELVLTANGDTVALRGTPTQLEQFRPEQNVTVPYQRFGETRWLLSQGIGGAGQQTALLQTVSGTVSEFNQEDGTVVIGDRTYFAHPLQLEQLQRGQQLQATYQKVGDNFWLQQIQAGVGGAGQQGQQGEMGQQGQMDQQDQMGQMGQTEQLQGRVIDVNPNAGRMTFSANGRQLSVRGTPTQLQRYRNDQQVTLQTRKYGQTPWLVGEGIGGTGEGAGQTETVTGTVSRLDPEQGTVVIGNRTFNAHPMQLQQLQDGEQTTARYQSFGSDNWLQSVQPGTGGSGQQQGGMQQGQQGGMEQGGMEQGGQQQQGVEVSQPQQLQGRVIRVNRNDGTMTVAMDGRQLSVRATPTQLERFSPNQQVNVQYRTYGRNAWLVGEGIGGAGQQGAGSAKTVSGRVSKIDAEQGTVTIGNRTLNAHPMQLQPLQQGQQVTANYQTFGEKTWLQNIQGGTGGSGQQQGGMQQGECPSGQCGTGMQQGGMMQQGQGGMQQGQVQQLQGRVVQIDPNAGTMVVSANGKSVTVRGTPTQLQRYSRDQQVNLQWRAYGGNPWLVGEGIGGAGTGAGSTRTITGSVSRIDPAQGTVVIAGRTFMAHPMQLQQLQQGQQVTANYQAFGNNSWIQNVQGQMGGSQQQQQ